MTQPQTLVTVGEFWEKYAARDFPRYELVRGDPVEVAPPGRIHGEIAANITILLGTHVRRNNLGRVMVETGYRLEKDPDTLRGPDVPFISAGRVSAEGLGSAYVQGPPDLAVEVVSPSDSAAEVEGKVHDYLSNGTRRVWVVYASTKRLLAYSLDGSVRWYQEEDTLEDQELLPGFAVPLAELFPSE